MMNEDIWVLAAFAEAAASDLLIGVNNPGCSIGRSSPCAAQDTVEREENLMLDIEASIVIRNILLIQLIIIFLVPDYAFQARQMLKIWKSLNTPVLIKKPSHKKKTEKFWEIDMTKFEP